MLFLTMTILAISICFVPTRSRTPYIHIDHLAGTKTEVDFNRHWRETQDLFEHADRVECYELCYGTPAGQKPIGRIDGIAYYVPPVVEGPQYARDLSDITLDPANYSQFGVTVDGVNCENLPDALCRVIRGTKHVDVVICWTCSEDVAITFVVDDKAAPLVRISDMDYAEDDPATAYAYLSLLQDVRGTAKSTQGMAALWQRLSKVIRRPFQDRNK